MREVAFLKQNAEKWKQFEALLWKKRRADPDRLAELFVEITDDLSYARTFFPESRTTHYLNDLAAEIHQAIYKNKREDRRRFAMFWRVEVPLTVRAAHRALLVSLVIFVIAMGIGVVSTLNDDGFARLILGETTAMVADLNPGPASGVGFDYTVFDDKLYFFANDGVYGRELWVWDGTSPTLIADICPGCRLAEPTGLTVFDNHLYFASDDGVHGQELWRSDGRNAERVADIRPGPQGSHPNAFTVLNNQLFFTADDGTHGREWW